jgi:hypothetical protein
MFRAVVAPSILQLYRTLSLVAPGAGMADDQDGPRPSPKRPQNANGAGQGPRELDRLPPPAFPPGQRMSGRMRPRAESRRAEGSGEGVPDDAFISPDEPIVRSGSRIAAGAFISPDEPLPSRDHVDPDQVVVTGIGDDPHLGHEELPASQKTDPQVADLALRVRRLADALEYRGEAGLRTTSDMNRFEATLRAYCVGYLAAQRETRSEQ